MKPSNLIIAITVVSLFAFRLVSLAQNHTRHHPKQDKENANLHGQAKTVYTCPMHPEVTADQPGSCPKCGMNLEKKSSEQRSMSQMMGKPTFEQSIEGVHIQVWLITQETHKKMMAEHMKDSSHGMMSGHDNMDMGMKDSMKDTKHEMMQAMMAGTHHVMVMATDLATKEANEKMNVKIALTSPSKMSSMVELKEMMNHFGGSLNLEEKGTYTFDVWLSIDGKIRTVSFDYQVK